MFDDRPFNHGPLRFHPRGQGISKGWAPEGWHGRGRFNKPMSSAEELEKFCQYVLSDALLEDTVKLHGGEAFLVTGSHADNDLHALLTHVANEQNPFIAPPTVSISCTIPTFGEVQQIVRDIQQWCAAVKQSHATKSGPLQPSPSSATPQAAQGTTTSSVSSGSKSASPTISLCKELLTVDGEQVNLTVSQAKLIEKLMKEPDFRTEVVTLVGSLGSSKKTVTNIRSRLAKRLILQRKPVLTKLGRYLRDQQDRGWIHLPPDTIVIR